MESPVMNPPQTSNCDEATIPMLPWIEAMPGYGMALDVGHLPRLTAGHLHTLETKGHDSLSLEPTL